MKFSVLRETLSLQFSKGQKPADTEHDKCMEIHSISDLFALDSGR